MKLHQLRYFQCLAHYLHYRKASEALYISQPTLSFAIKELEDVYKRQFLTRYLINDLNIFTNIHH